MFQVEASNPRIVYDTDEASLIVLKEPLNVGTTGWIEDMNVKCEAVLQKPLLVITSIQQLNAIHVKLDKDTYQYLYHAICSGCPKVYYLERRRARHGQRKINFTNYSRINHYRLGSSHPSEAGNTRRGTQA